MKKLKRFARNAVLYLLVLTFLPLHMVSGARAATTKENDAAYQIYPTPHQLAYASSESTLTNEVNVVFESGIDEATKNHLSDTLALRGLTGTASNAVQNGKLNVLVGIKNSGGFVDLYADQNVTNEDSFFDQTDAYLLSIKENLITILAKDTDSAFCGITTLKSIFKQLSENKVRDLRVDDFSDTPWRGFIEGYYGVPYSNENRMDLMEFGSDNKMNSYIFAPKDDPYHQSQWKTLYPADVLNNKIKPLIDKGNETKVRFIFAIHPFMNNPISTANFDNDIQLILQKYEQMYAAGVRQFALLGDDAGGEVALHVKVINALNQWVKSKPDTYPLIFCPNAYYGNPNSGSNKTYFATLNSVDPDVQVMYTGDAIIGNVDAAAYQNFYNAFVSAQYPQGRVPYVWLNWPVNDYTDASLFLGKGQILKQGVKNFSGLVSNPMCEAQLSKIALFQISDFIWNSDAFDVDQSWADSFSYVDPDAAAELAVLARHMNYPKDGVYHQTGLAWDESEDLAPLMEEFKSKLKANEDIHSVAQTLIGKLEEIKSAGKNVLLKSKNEALKNEIAPYIASLSATVEADLSIIRCALAIADNDVNAAWTAYSGVASNIELSNSVTKPGFKPEGNVNLDVRPGTKYLRPFAREMSAVMDSYVKDAIGLDSSSSSTGERTPISHFGQFTASSDEIAKLFDGDKNTYMSLQNGVQKEGDYVGVDLGGVFPISHISILQGSSDADHDILHYTVLEVSKDNKTWTTVKDFSETAATNKVECDTTEKARYVRFRLVREGYNSKPDYWLHIREFTVETGSETEAISNITAPATVTEEGSTLTIAANAPINLAKGQYFGFKLPQLVSVDLSKVAAYQGLTLQYSDNAKNWTAANGAATVTARFVRLINLGETAVQNVKPSLTVSVPKIDPASVSLDGSALNGTKAGMIFDANEATQGKFNAKSVTIDLGQTVDIRNLDLSVSEDTATDSLLGAGKVEVSTDGANWKTLRAYNITDKSADPANPNNFDSHTAPYFYVNIAPETPVAARYIRINETNTKQFVLNEVIVNKGKPLPSSVDQRVKLDGSYLDNFSIEKASDGKLDTYFRANAAAPKGGSIVYTFTNEEFAKDFVVVQNANTPSHAKVEALASDGSWKLVGTLDQAINRFDLSAISNARAARIVWEEDAPEFYLHELFYEQMNAKTAAEATAHDIIAKTYAGYLAEDVTALKVAAGTLLATASALNAEQAAASMEALRTQEASLREAENVDTTALAAAIDKASKIDLNNYMGGEAGNKTFTDALAAARAALTSSSQQEIDNAKNTLEAAYNALIKKASAETMKALRDFVDEVAKLSAKDYSTESWKIIDAAAAKVTAALSAGEISETAAAGLMADVVEAQKRIANPDAPKPDTSALQEIIARAERIDLNQYVGGQQGNKTFTDALAAARAALTSSSQQEIDNAKNTLEAACNALVKKASDQTISTLQGFVESVKALNAKDYTEATFASIQAAADKISAALNAGELSERDAALLLGDMEYAKALIAKPDAKPTPSESEPSEPSVPDPSDPDSSKPDSEVPSESTPSDVSSAPAADKPTTGDVSGLSAILLVAAAAGVALVVSRRKRKEF